uniref:Uncharacterized protein n=1 Tax=Globodera rostochiensis TaxID=31243 RepID=A0A914HJ24_GLORO
MIYYSLFEFPFLIISFVALMTEAQDFPPVQPVPAPPAAEPQNMVENATATATTATGFPPTPTGSTPGGPLNRMGNFLSGLVGGEQQQQETTTPGANASDHEALSNNDRVANASSTASANIGDAGGIATTVTPPLDNTTSNVFSSTTEMSPSIVEGPEVEVWNFAEGMDNMTTTTSSTSSTTTERPPVPASAAVALNAWAVNLVASAAFAGVVFFHRF